MQAANLVVVRSFNSQMEADLAKSALASAGIDALIQADSAGGMRPQLAWSTGGFKLFVREEGRGCTECAQAAAALISALVY